ncbi:aminomethyltransferase family protein [Phyllobacterium sp. YR531]|uniref:aminomethyltransferase family protein n=1 Tax=Phyllobacterium sp. YR531 TaxID=1144343 RepID=UPI00026FC326|nr:aminomethyltransferase family protein [Phyllobacterium sp. YR531]EJN06823.1 glycine cleavage system T protein (aminomethyltransferase) [Phyllobacterium sp. YR531]
MAAGEGAPKSLEALIDEAGGAVKLLRGSNLGPYVFPGIPPEFSNWRDEVQAWKDSVALLELSYHMTELHLRGRDVIPFLGQFAVNKLDPFQVKRAKQIVLAGHDGNFIADAILFREEEEFFRIVGAPFASDWLLYNAQNSPLSITVEKNDNWSVRQTPRDVFRLQVQGPEALPLMQEVTGNTLPDIKFFFVGELQIAGKTVRALRHGMAGTPGFELYGPWDDQQTVRETLEKVGEKYGMRKVGALAYSATAQESGWMPMPMPAIYHGSEMKPYREWLNNYFLETIGSLGGSFISDRIEDYYVDPIELGYGSLVDWNRDFLGRAALKEKAANQKRTKVTLVWNDDDVAATIKASLFDNQKPDRFMALPNPMYATFQADAVFKGANAAGVSQWLAYSANAQHVISLAVVNVEDATPGTELTLLWGEPNSRRRTVDRHDVREIRVTVAPAPYFDKVIKIGHQ